MTFHLNLISGHKEIHFLLFLILFWFCALKILVSTQSESPHTSKPSHTPRKGLIACDPLFLWVWIVPTLNSINSVIVSFDINPEGFPSRCVVKNPPANAGDTGLIPGFVQYRGMQPTPVFLPWESHGQRSLAGYSPWGHRVKQLSDGLPTTSPHPCPQNLGCVDL